MSLKSRIPEIIAALDPAVEEATTAGAELIVESAKTRVPVGERAPHLRDRIHIEHVPGEGWYVVAGDRETFYGHIVEHGSVFAAARPFLVPALEENRGKVEAGVREAIRKAAG